MKKIVSAIVALLLCCALVTPAFATFVPSISYDGAPEVVPVKDPNGDLKLGVISNASGQVSSYVDQGCLVVTPVSKLAESEEIPDDAAAMLLYVYNGLRSGSLKLPYDKMGNGLSDENTAVRELFDVTWLCGDHPEMLEAAGVTMTVTFDLGIEADAKVHVLTYKNNAFNPIAYVKNNGDGTVTCVFEHLCPVAFVVETEEGEIPAPGTGDGMVMGLFATMMLLAAAGVVVLKKKAA